MFVQSALKLMEAQLAPPPQHGAPIPLLRYRRRGSRKPLGNTKVQC